MELTQQKYYGVATLREVCELIDRLMKDKVSGTIIINIKNGDVSGAETRPSEKE